VPDFDVNTPHIGRIYDYWLGGKDNFEADRKAAELALAATPTIVPGVRANRRFLGGAVRYLAAENGIRQFLVIGTGIPASILHCIPDEDDPGRLVRDLMAATAPGGFLAITHPASDQLAVATEAEISMTRSIGQKMTFRRQDEVAGFFAGLDLVEPGVVPVQDWRATSELDFNSAPTAMWGGVGRKE
jgi:S-adenosyl methyltransferase